MALKKVTLADKYDLTQDRIFATGYQALVPESNRSGMFLSAKTSLTQDVELFGELLVSKYKNHGANTPPFLQLTNITNTVYQEVAGVAMPKRSVLGGIEFRLRDR